MAELSATIRYPRDERLLALFAPENKELHRARYELRLTDDAAEFFITAHDATALRACMTTITKVLSVWETTVLDGPARETDH